MSPHTDNPSNDNTLSPVEAYLLEQKGYYAIEVEAIERAIASGSKIEGRLSYLNDDRASGKRKSDSEVPGTSESEQAVSKPAVATFDVEEWWPGLKAVWKKEGVLGVIRDYPDFVVLVEDTFYTFRDWEQAQQAFTYAALTPLPGQAEIETACGPGGLDLPSVTIDGTLYFDFEFVGKSDEAKARRASEHARAREEALRYLVGKRLERYEP